MQYHHLLALYAIGAFAQSSDDGATTATSDTVLITFTDSSTITTTASASMSTMTTSNSSSSGVITESIYGLGNTVNTYGASVLGADQESTTYVASCVTGRLLCINDDFTMTSGSTALHITNAGISLGVHYSESLTCQVSGTTSASCVYSLGISSGGKQTSTVVTTTESAATIPYATFVVTAGQEKLAAASTIPHTGTNTNAGARATLLSSKTQKGLLATMVGSASAVLAFAILL